MTDPRILPPTPENIEKAARLIRAGALVAFPTETVYGLGANGFDGAACRAIYAAKGRPSDNPLILHIPQASGLPALCREIPEKAYALCEAFAPGPLTLVLKKTAAVPNAVSAGLDTVAVRIPSHPVARALLKACGVPIAAPSANKSGSPSPTTAAHVAADIGAELPLILDGGPCGVGLESTIVSLSGPVPKLLRPGGISLEALEAVIGPVEVDGAVFGQLPEGVAPAAPGMKYRHYAPMAEVILLNGTRENVLNYMAEQKGAGVLCHDGEEGLFPSAGHVISLGGTQESAARRLFAALREMDAAGVPRIYCGLPDKSGVGLAVYNRLLKAAAGRVMEC